jgi:organic radical activating enzyme
MSSPQIVVDSISQKEYPIAEQFDSIQGEGRWAGTAMRFIRLAGCNVGKPRTRETNLELTRHGAPLHVLEQSPNHTACHLWNGKHMVCDTDYRTSTRARIMDLLAGYKGDHICITGGEPFLHDLGPLVLAGQLAGFTVHIETSGTLPFKLEGAGLINPKNVWITCSPKHGFLFDQAQCEAISEIKMLVYPDTPVSDLLDWRARFMGTLTIFAPYPEFYLSPITNAIDKPQTASLKRCIEIVNRHPDTFSLSVQAHKYWEVR